MIIDCIKCPKGCQLEAVKCDDGSIAVTGNCCPRGIAYGRDELVNPTRMVTGLVRIAGMRRPLPVKTKTEVPKSRIKDVLAVMHRTMVRIPVRIGDVVISDVAGCGVDVVATANM